MLQIKILTIGKTRELFFQEAEKVFLTRLKKFVQIEIRYLIGEKISPSKTSTQILQQEGERILRELNEQFFNIALDVKGKELDSNEFAEFLGKNLNQGRKICFVLGGPLGLSPEVLKKCEFSLSLSKLTFTHELARIVLLEQIYRGFQILGGTKYHKD